ncbi:hypothetical protein [Fulvivirga sediminis]|uniref:Uncharacterized protein n=1 Tax=Fulvivirga sediminis TaxID=2803949 RepID=A0A937F2M6_9BACT|nr:hypothetical protein [Fulvivirga sediminis]MBL3654590.1 hypothetical protein [Fulvivirga sediminis]
MNNHIEGKKKDKKNLANKKEETKENDIEEFNSFGILPHNNIKKNLGCGG